MALKRFPNEDVRNSKFIVRILLVHFVFYEKIVIVAALIEDSLALKNKERERNPFVFIHRLFDIYLLKLLLNRILLFVK